MVLPLVGAGDGPILGEGQAYRDLDLSSPAFPTEFTAEVTSLDGVTAKVSIQHGYAGPGPDPAPELWQRPDPCIRPWNPPNYRSPDIEVRNALNQGADADPEWTNRPWRNNRNTVVARITNHGRLDAPGVVVDFFVKDYTVNSEGTQPTPVGQDSRDVPAGDTVEFSAEWVPPQEGHFCIVARVREYTTPPAGSVPELFSGNNEAQSNYEVFSSESVSPASRETAMVKIANTFDVPARATVRIVKHTSPLYRTYLEHSWLHLQPGETREVRVMFEYGHGTETVTDPNLFPFLEFPNDASIDAVLHVEDGDVEVQQFPLGGVNARVITGRGTKFDTFWHEPQDYEIGGRIVATGDHFPVPGGEVVLTFQTGSGPHYVRTTVGPQGTFDVIRTEPWASVRAQYLGLAGYADSQSGKLAP